MINRAEIVDRNYVKLLTEWKEEVPRRAPELPVREGAPLTGAALLELAEAQLVCRHLDLAARELRALDQSYYTIGSAGHEGNAVLGRVTRHTDPALLHYRSGALVAERARQRPEVDVVRDTLLGLVASREEPIAGGRHKVWGSRPLWILPQTSTIASHLPKAVGLAVAIERSRRLAQTPPLPRDSIVLCSFGDASLNHSTAQGAINAALYSAHRRLPVPILFVCEDNGIGISTRTPVDWVRTTCGSRPHLRYFFADGRDLVETHRVAEEAARVCREQRVPVFLHLQVVRLLGHAGSDYEGAYRTKEEIEATEALDPLLATARLVLRAGLASPEELLSRYEALRRRVREEASYAVSRPKLTSAAEVLEPLAPHHPDRVATEAGRPLAEEQRALAFGSGAQSPESGPPKHLAVQLNRALTELLVKYPQATVFGEDVAEKGGVYHVTTGLYRKFGPGRVFNTILDEQSILGLAQGLATLGLLPIPEIQYLAYVHNAEDQLRGEACSTQYFSCDQFRNPMVVRIAGLGYQKGFGGHFHNDNSLAALRDIPGLVLAVPARGDDAVGMLRTAMALAAVDGRVVVFLEPIALYMTKDLHADGDGLWLTDYPAPEHQIPVGEGRVYHPEARELLVLSYANGLYFALRAAKRLSEQHGLPTRVVDLRWLNPLNEEFIAAQAAECRAVLVVDEGRRTGGVGEAILGVLAERCRPLPPVARVAGEDCYIPLGPAARLVLPSEEQIVEAALRLSPR
ncbi:MAG: MFS transporter [Deltaproteobacteria bacterium]|nr:MFS transporter [Deltaproteobacteria bacterium]